MSFDAPLGSSQMFDNWGKGASGSKISQATYGTNMYAALEAMDNERRSTSTFSYSSSFRFSSPLF